MIFIGVGLSALLMVAGRMGQIQLLQVFLIINCNSPELQEQQFFERLPRADQGLRNFLHWQNEENKCVAATSNQWHCQLADNCQFAWELLPALFNWLNQLPLSTSIALLGWRRAFSVWRQPPVNLKPLQLALTPADLWNLPYPLPSGCVLQRHPNNQANQIPEAQLAACLGIATPLAMFAEPILEYSFLPINPEIYVEQRDRHTAAQCQQRGWRWRQELELRRHSRWLAAWQAFEQGDSAKSLEFWRRGCCHSQAPLAKQWLDALHLFASCQELQPAPVTLADLLRQPNWKQVGCDLLAINPIL